MLIACAHCLTTNRVPDERLQDDPVCGRCGRADRAAAAAAQIAQWAKVN
jgi:hypothetical protein